MASLSIPKGMSLEKKKEVLKDRKARLRLMLSFGPTPNRSLTLMKWLKKVIAELEEEIKKEEGSNGKP